MNKEELEQLFLGDDEYVKTIKECEEWIQGFIDNTPDDKKSSSAAKYLRKVIEAVSSFEELLTGVYGEDVVEEFGPKKGEDFNLATIPFFQTQLLSVHYRISLVNREVQKVINDFLDFDELQSPFQEVLDTLIDRKQTEIFVRGYVPQYVYDLEMKTFHS